MAATSQATAPARVREYETIYILRSDIDSESAGRVSTRVAEVIGREAGVLVKVETWGRRRLAFPIAKQRRGVYTYIKFLGGGALVNELERNLRMLDPVLRFQTVMLRDDLVPTDVSVDPEEVTFAAIEPAADDEREETRERLLGLVESQEDRRGSRRHDIDDGDYEEPSLNPDLADPEGDEK